MLVCLSVCDSLIVIILPFFSCLCYATVVRMHSSDFLSVVSSLVTLGSAPLRNLNRKLALINKV